MKIKTIILTITIALLSTLCAAKTPQPTRILMIGNSFTYYNDMPSMLDSLAKSQGRTLDISVVAPGGQTLAGHLKDTNLLKLLAGGRWDYVILQEQSVAPALSTHQVAQMVYPAAHALDSLIHAGSPAAKVIFYMTWGHKNGFAEPIPEYPSVNNYHGMLARLVSSYLEMTYDNNATCAPVGLAFDRLRRQAPNLDPYDPSDAYHPSPIGSYLAANVILATLFPGTQSPDYTAGLDPDTATLLRQIARHTVTDNAPMLNLTIPTH